MNLPIGELSRLTGVKVPTIRFYEQIGLIDAPQRTEGNQRRYGQGEVERLNFIRHARELGFPLDAIRDLLSLSDSPDHSCDSADAIARAQFAATRTRIARLKALEAELERMVAQGAHGTIAQCRVIEVLGDHSRCLHDHHAEPDGIGAPLA